MSANPTTIAGFDVYPSMVQPSTLALGGPQRRALSGKGYIKRTAQKKKVVIGFDGADGDVLAVLNVIWQQALAGSVSLVNTDYGINSNFNCTDQEFKFVPQEGPYSLYAGSLTFEEV